MVFEAIDVAGFNRPIIEPLEQIRSYDIEWGWKDAMIGSAGLAQMFLGNSNTALSQLLGTQTVSPSLVINIGPGAILQLAETDATVYGALPGDTTLIMQLGGYGGGTLTLINGCGAGQSQWILVQVGFGQVDAIRAGDPDSGIPPYVNVADPPQPFAGQNNSGLPQNTVRDGVALIQLKAGAPATTSSEVPPTADSGFVPLYLIHLTFGQTTVTTGQIQTAGPGVYGGYPYAPIFPGVVGSVPGSSGSHHGGIAGQANKILLTNGAEVAGQLPLANSYTTNNVIVPVGGGITVATEIPVITAGTINPQGLVAGNVDDLFFNQTLGFLWICTTSGTSGSAVWSMVGNGGVWLPKNVAFTAAPGNGYVCDTSGGVIAVTLNLAATYGGLAVRFKNKGANDVTITPNGGESIEDLAAGVALTLPGGSRASTVLAPEASVGFHIVN